MPLYRHTYLYTVWIQEVILCLPEKSPKVKLPLIAYNMRVARMTRFVVQSHPFLVANLEVSIQAMTQLVVVISKGLPLTPSHVPAFIIHHDVLTSRHRLTSNQLVCQVIIVLYGVFCMGRREIY